MATRTPDLYRVKVVKSITYRHVARILKQLREVDLDPVWTPRALPCESGPHTDLARLESLDLTAGIWNHSCLARTRAVANAFRMSSPSCPWRRRRQHFGFYIRMATMAPTDVMSSRFSLPPRCRPFCSVEALPERSAALRPGLCDTPQGPETDKPEAFPPTLHRAASPWQT